MPLFIISDWLMPRKILRDDLEEFQQVFSKKNESVFSDLSEELLKHFYQSVSKVLFFKVVRVLGFYGIIFSGKLSAYSGPNSREPEVLSIAFNHREKKLTDYIGMPSSALLKSCGIETLEQLHGVPVLSLKKLLDCTSFEDFLANLPATIVPAAPRFFLPISQEESTQETQDRQIEEDVFCQSIDILNLSVRPYNCLIQKGIATVGELVTQRPEDLLNTKNFGRKSLREIILKLSQHDLQLSSDIEEINISNKVGQIEGQYDLPIEKMELSVKAVNCLQNFNITTVSQLIKLSNSELLALPNLGHKTLTELQQKIINLRADVAIPLQLNLWDVDKGISIDLNNKETLVNLSTSIHNLILSVRTQNALDSHKIKYIWEVSQLTEKKLLKIKNFGRKSLSELKSKLYELDLSLGISLTPEQIKTIRSFELTVSMQDLNTRFLQIIAELQSEIIPFLGKRENQIAHERLWPITTKKRTLEEIASDWLISRERIRQIERKTKQKILQQYRKDLCDIVKIVTQELLSHKGLSAISLLSIRISCIDQCGQNIISELFSLVDDNIFCDWENDLISGKGENWLNEICHSVRKNIQNSCHDKYFSIQILESAVSQTIKIYNLIEGNVLNPLINKVKVSEKITSLDGLLCFGRMLKQDKAALAFLKHFPNGLELHKKGELLVKTLKEYDPVTYQDIIPRSIITKLSDHEDIFLWGRGFYVHRESVTFDKKTVNRAADWIIHRFDSGNPKFQIDLPFNNFKEDMLIGGIPNEYALYTLMRTLNNDRIGLRKFPSVVDCQSEVDINETVVEELENYLLTAKRAISAIDLKKEFVENRGWKHYRLNMSLSSNSENIYPWLNNSYIHLEYLQVNYDKLEDLIDSLRSKLITINGAYSLKGAKRELQVLWHQVIPDAPISTMIKLIRSVNSTDLEINHYLVSLRHDEGMEALSLAEEIEDYFIEENREVSTLELKKEFQEKRGWSDNQYYGAIRKSTLFQMSKTSFVHPSTIGWNSELYEEVHAVLSENLQNKNSSGIPHINLSEIIDQYLLPELPNGIEWTIELLISVDGEHNNFLFFDDACTFVGNHFDIEDLDDMIAFLISQSFEYSLGKQKDVERLLWREGIIASGRAIPKNEVFFPESSIVYLPDSDEITLSQIGEERYGSKIPA